MVKTSKSTKSAPPRAKSASPGVTAQPKELGSILHEEESLSEGMDSSDEASEEEDAFPQTITSSEVA